MWTSGRQRLLQGSHMEQTIATLPSYLKTYIVTQDRDRYTSRDHAAWRYIMRQSRAYFKDHAVPIYLKGLEKTGITLDKIPLIAEMDAKLKRLGWGAVPVCGFIPPAVFLDFQARKILPIAFDMRSLDNIAYTPAPDIVHEAAGHAPIIADEQYSNYLTMYANMAQKAIFSREDLDLYEAIRTLSDVKENPDSTKDTIAAADAALGRATAALSFVSEANKVARMNWWTVEYGLLGSVEQPKIYGAGLLSSVGESQACLSPKVKKLRLSIDCIDMPYDITEPQPQLFVAEDIPHLVAVLKELEASLAYSRGGIYGLTQAKLGRTVTTTVLDSGIQISGRLDDYLATGDSVEFVRLGSPVQLAFENQELLGQGTSQHPHGFSSPLGRLKLRPDKPITHLDDNALRDAGIRCGARTRIELTSGFVIEGHVAQVLRKGGKIILITWKDVQVTRGSQVYFEPAWGDFDMAVGERIVSVSGGPADREKYDYLEVGKTSTTPSRTSPYNAGEIAAFEAYAQVRKIRDALKTGVTNTVTSEKAIAIAEDLAQKFPKEWLLILEALEISRYASQNESSDDVTRHLNRLTEQLQEYAKNSGDTLEWLVRQGLSIASIPD